MKQLFDYCFYRIALFYKKRMPFEDYKTNINMNDINGLKDCWCFCF